MLPVLVPELDYAGMDVASGTDAMEAWQRLIALKNDRDKKKLKREMLDYCELDTLAMVKIFDFMDNLQSWKIWRIGDRQIFTDSYSWC